jgi:hypothetical protein
MSWNAQRFINKKELIERDRISLAFQEEEATKQNETRIFCIVGDIWNAACHVFPSLLCPEDEYGAYKKDGIWYTYSSSRQVCVDNAKPAPWVCFGQEGSLIAASEVIAYMQSRNHEGWIEFCDGTRMDVHDYLLPDWASHGSWYRSRCKYGSYWDEQNSQKNQVEFLLNAWHEEIWEKFSKAKEEMYLNFNPLGDGYYESKDPNDFLFYTNSMIEALVENWPSDEMRQQKRLEIQEQLRSDSPYAAKFAKALALVA